MKCPFSCASVLVVIVASGLAVGQTAPERPAWAKGVSGWGVLEIPQAQGKRDLEKIAWEGGTVVAEDGRDNIYLLRVPKGVIEKYSPEGKLKDRFVLESWRDAQTILALSAFAVDRRGDMFAFADREDIWIFDEKRVLATAKLPTFVTGLAFVGSDLLVAHLPVEFTHTIRDGEPVINQGRLITRLGINGKVLDETLSPDDAKGPDPFSIAMT